MTKKDDDEVARTERARRIGLFRYMLIREAADPSLTGRQRGALVRKLAQAEHIDADGRPVRITRWTLDRWILEWRQGGFDALVPSPRQSQPRTPPRGGRAGHGVEEGEPGPHGRAGQKDSAGSAGMGAG
ncbi:helix-turn-helix domain-containing protein [Streptomyces sp. NBC_00996]|uniref:helix-turn-helix domain-containing protein n=1 Tax=Streptomyces sp. NBC_00996 TaxID=2903710 RepID=UPI003868BBCC|nr:helix-turn-helix domain containing protein [Streptomyces sp. NBC_00996]